MSNVGRRQESPPRDSLRLTEKSRTRGPWAWNLHRTLEQVEFTGGERLVETGVDLV